jgi:hypothetical protein
MIPKNVNPPKTKIRAKMCEKETKADKSRLGGMRLLQMRSMFMSSSAVMARRNGCAASCKNNEDQKQRIEEYQSKMRIRIIYFVENTAP